MAFFADRGSSTLEKMAAPVSTAPVASAGIRVSSYIGKGNFAFVYKGVYNQRQVAIKVVPFTAHSDQAAFAIQSLIHEARLLRRCSHPNVLKFYGTAVLEGKALHRMPHGHHFAAKQGFAIVEELATGDTLLNMVLTQTLHRRRRVYTSQQALQWVIDVARGIEHLHTRKRAVIHRDLKLENVLLVHEGGRMVAKLADFGLCAYVTESGVPKSAVHAVAAPHCRGEALVRWAQDAAAVETPTHDSTHGSSKAASARCDACGSHAGGAEDGALADPAPPPLPLPAAKPSAQLYPRVSRLEPLAGLSVLNSVREEAAPGPPTTLSFGAVRVPLGPPPRVCARKVPISPDVVPVRAVTPSGIDNEDEGTHRGAVRCGSSSLYHLTLRQAFETFYPDNLTAGPLSSPGTDCTERITSMLGPPSASPTPSGRHFSDVGILDSRDTSNSIKFPTPDSRDVSNGGLSRLPDTAREAAVSSHVILDGGEGPASGGLPQRVVQSHNVLDGPVDTPHSSRHGHVARVNAGLPVAEGLERDTIDSLHSSPHTLLDSSVLGMLDSYFARADAGLPVSEGVEADTNDSLHASARAPPDPLVVGPQGTSALANPCSHAHVATQPPNVGSSRQLSPAGMSPATSESDVIILPVCPGRPASPRLAGAFRPSPLNSDVPCLDKPCQSTTAPNERHPADPSNPADALAPRVAPPAATVEDRGGVDEPASRPRRSLLDVATALRLNEPVRPRVSRRSHETARTATASSGVSHQASGPATPSSRPRKRLSRQLQRGTSDDSAAPSTPLSSRLSRAIPRVQSVGRSLKSALSGRVSRGNAKYAMTGRTGSLIYMAPEVKRCEEYNERVDIFAVGVLMWELFARQSILAKLASPTAIEEYSRKVADGAYRLPFPTNFPPELCDLISQCWSQDSKDRPSAVGLLEQLEHFERQGVVDDIFPTASCCGFR